MEAPPAAAKTSAQQASQADQPAGQQASSSYAAHEQNTTPAASSPQIQDDSTTRHREASRGSSVSSSDESQRTRVQEQNRSDHASSSPSSPLKSRKKPGQQDATAIPTSNVATTPGGQPLPSITRHATGYFGEQRAGEGVDVAKGEAAFQQLTRVLSTSYDFDLESHINLRKELLKRKGGVKDKYVGTTWENLTVVGKDSTGAFVKTLPDAILRTLLAKDFIDFVLGRVPALAKIIPGKKQPTRNLIQNFEGCVSQEMLLVLGRPGSGCSTFLRAVANEHKGFLDVQGELLYNGIDFKTVAKKYSQECIYNGEDDVHFPTLTTEQTLEFALSTKVPSKKVRVEGESAKTYVQIATHVLLKMFGIEHTANTKVGNEFIRGVSGGERKRISIAETLATSAALSSWDNSTRGLDSSTALDYVKSLRLLTDLIGRTNIVSLYQASDNIYDLFDKVCVIDEGKMIYFGPASTAREYFEGLGYAYPPRSTVPDFLTGITDPAERKVKQGFEKKAPRTPEDRERAFRESEVYKQLRADIQSLKQQFHQDDAGKDLKQAVKQQRSGGSSVYNRSLWQMTKALTKRQVLMKKGDMGALYVKTATNVVIALIVGSLFFNVGLTSTQGAFPKGGALFFSLLLLGWLNLSEIFEATSGRPVIARQHSFAFYRPSAQILSTIAVDIPINLLQAILWSIAFYFLAQLHRSASAFFIYLLFVFLTTISLTSFFRAVAALSPNFDTANRYSIIGLNIAIIFVGYVIPRSLMPSWFKWISYIQPLSFSFEALMANEFSRYTMTCAPASVIPQGAGTSEAFQTCALAGSTPGSLLVDGSAYIAQSFGYQYSHVWRNFGIVIAYTIGYIVAAALFSEFFNYAEPGGNTMAFVKTKEAKRAQRELRKSSDEEQKAVPPVLDEKNAPANGASGTDEKIEGIAESETVLTFKDICVTVQTADGPKMLLDHVSGYLKPGESVALMGSSGAGKTTLLNTITKRIAAQVEGDILLDGRPTDPDYQRRIGFAEQADIHDTSATIREALEFSALLRQPTKYSKEEKLKYCNKIMELLNFDKPDALIGSPEAGLSIEERKRLTIGVELAARPTIYTSLDEPTSGLDASGAMSIGRFIRKLANSGQGCLSTIHQPSSQLLTGCFDKVLLLSPGGKTAYFGPVTECVKYFESHGARHCDDDENIAEYALEVVGQPSSCKKPWGQLWKESEEHKKVIEEIDNIVRERSSQRGSQEAGEDVNRVYAASILEQTKLLTLRIGRNFYRDSSYAYGKILSNVFVGIFNGFTFYQLGNTVNDTQQIMFSIFLAILLLPALLNASIPKHFILKSLWQARESHSTYSWVAWMTAVLVNEVPYAIIQTLIYWPLAYWPVGFPFGEPAGLTFFNILLLNLFTVTFAHWMCALSPSPSLVANLLPFFLVSLNIYTGILVPWELMTAPWRWFLYYADPIVYFLRSQLAVVLHNRPVQCAATELFRFNPPAGQTCAAYAGAYATSMMASLSNPDATADCAYCQYTVADQYLSSINITYGTRWRDTGIFIAFNLSNIALCYGLFYFMQIKGGAMVLTSFPSIIKKKLASRKSNK